MDRLSTLMERFEMDIHPAPAAEANFLVLAGGQGRFEAICFTRRAGSLPPSPLVFSARVQWGGAANPLMAALPEAVHLPLSEAPELQGVLSLLQSELEAPRCGGPSVLRRLSEVLMVRLLRHQIELGSAEPGVLSGLADPRLHRAVVAIHDRPGHGWTNADLAQEAGLSLSRFAELFATTVGMTPMAYLRHWRLTVAHQDLSRGDGVAQVARRYGYGSAEAFSRAFRARFGDRPVAVRVARGEVRQVVRAD